MPKQTFFNLPYKKKQHIINAAYDIFINMDYENINIRDITRKADISIGSFYQYFNNKDDLYLYLQSNIEKKVYAYQKEYIGSLLLEREIIPIENICTEKEIAFNRTWHKAPIEILMKFYFGEYSKELNSDIMDELILLKNSGKLKDSVDIDLFFHLYVTSMFNISIYFRQNNITDINKKIEIKKSFYYDLLLTGILKVDIPQKNI